MNPIPIINSSRPIDAYMLVNLAIIDACTVLSPVRHQGIISTDADFLILIIVDKFQGNLSRNLTFSFNNTLFV